MAGNHTGDFGVALEALKAGGKVAREGWNGKSQFLYLTRGKSPIGDFIVICPVKGPYMPWVASQTDLLADDWYQVV